MDFLIIFISCILIAIVILVLILIFKSPFKYPYYEQVFDVSGKRTVSIYDLIDNFFNKRGFYSFIKHNNKIVAWKKECEERIERSILKKLRLQQYQNSIDDNRVFCFKLIRKQTRYKQLNYIKKPYSIYIIDKKYSFSFEFLQNRYEKLSSIGFECTLLEYHSKEQRKIMTKSLRLQIMQRDNYTCQYCGKYMPDEVGLQIDHIVPIVKGGKSIPSNLQVLCSKCNGKKSKN